MAEPTNPQLMRQAQGAGLTLPQLIQRRRQGTPNITQPQQANISPTPAPDIPEEEAIGARPPLVDLIRQHRQATQTGVAPASRPGRRERLLQQQKEALAAAEAVEQPSFIQPIIDTAEDAGKFAVQAAVEGAIPGALAGAGGLVGSIAGPAGTVVGLAAGSAAGTYINDLLNIQDADIIDYTAATLLPVLPAAAKKGIKILGKRLPAVQDSMKKLGNSLIDDLTELVVKDPGDAAVKGAFKHLDDLQVRMPTKEMQTAYEGISDPARKVINKQLNKFNPDISDTLTDRSIVEMTPSNLRDLRTTLNETADGLRKSKKLGDKRIAKEVQDLSNQIDERINQLADAGNSGARGIKQANALARQQKVHRELDGILQGAKTVKTKGGEFIREINIGNIVKRIENAERIISKGGTPTDKKMASVVRFLREDPDNMKTLMSGLKDVAKSIPDESVLLVGRTGGGIAERTVRAIGEEINTGALARIMSSSVGQKLLKQTLKTSKGRINAETLAVLLAALRPVMSGVPPEKDPLVQKVAGKVEQGRQLLQQATQNTPTKAETNQ